MYSNINIKQLQDILNKTKNTKERTKIKVKISIVYSTQRC